MGSPAQRKAGVLAYPGTNIVPPETTRDIWPQCPTEKNSLWIMADEMPSRIAIPFESVDVEEPQIYQTLFEYHPGGEGIIVDPRSILRISIKRAEMRS